MNRGFFVWVGVPIFAATKNEQAEQATTISTFLAKFYAVLRK